MPRHSSRRWTGHADGPLAVVAGAACATALGSGRALHQFGAEVWGITKSSEDATLRSRAWDRLDVVGDGPDAWFIALERLTGEIERPAFLLPTNDLLVAAFSSRRDELDAKYRFVMPPDSIVQTFLQKTLFYDWARPKGLPLPESVLACSDAELRCALRDLPYPLILKPTYRTESWNLASPSNKVIKLQAPGDLAKIPFDLFSVAPSYIVSHWIEGPDSAVHFCLAYCARPGEVTASFTGRKLLQYPRFTGSTAVCVDTRNGEVEELTREVFRLAGFQGIGSLELKYDLDGKAYITEPTVGRPNLQSHSAVSSGCNLHAIAMADALQLEMKPGTGAHRKCWWVEEHNVGELIAAGGFSTIPWRLLGRELLRARLPSFSYWSWRDPLPALVLIGQGVRRAIRGVFRRVLRRLNGKR